MTDPVPFYEAAQEFDPAIPLDSLREHPKNYNKADEELLARLLDAHGFYGGIIIQKSSGLILVGNHRYRKAKQKGAVTMPGFWLDVDDDEAEEILAADNLSSKLAVFDEARLIELLTARQESPRGLAGTGYGDAALQALIRHQASITAPPANPEDEWEGMPDFNQPDGTPAYSVVIHFPTDDDAATFFALIGKERPAQKFLWWPKHDGFRGLDHSVMEVAKEDDPGE